MDNFNIKRFGQTFRWMLVTNLQTFLAFTAGCAAAVFLLEMLLIAFSCHSDGSNYTPLLHSTITQFFVIFLIIYVFVAISTLFSYYLKKPQREAFLMLPSTNLEKFLAAVIYVTVVWTLAGFLAFAVGDTLRMVVRALVYGNEWVSAIPNVVRGFIPNIVLYDDSHVYSLTYKVMNLFVGYNFIMWIHSLYTLGGTFFRKYAFVATSAVMFFLMIVLSWVINHFGASMFTSQWDGNAYVGEEVGFLAYILAVLLPLLSIFNYWASFHIFKGFQLITNKWTNYDILK